MSLDILKLAMPLLVGYSVFAGISGRLNPFSIPYSENLKAHRVRAIGVGLAVTIALIIASGAIQNVPILDTVSPISLASVVFIVLTVPFIALYELSRYGSKQSGKSTKTPGADITTDKAVAVPNTDKANNPHVMSAEGEDIQTANVQKEPCKSDDVPSEVSPTYLPTVQVEQLSCETNVEAVNDASTAATLDSKAATGNISSIRTTELPRQKHSPRKPAGTDNLKLSAKLAAEKALRKQTENHLRITRKALSTLEAQTRDKALGEVEALQDVEEKLADSIASATDLETQILHERNKRLEAEQRVVEMKQKIMKARQKLKHSAAARARALGTANKSVAFARQSVQIRGRLEADLEKANVKLVSHKRTINSLVRALEKEKRRSKDDIASAAKQLLLHERQMTARRSLEDTARSVENKLASRLIKKVAKARPVTQPNEIQGKTE